MESDLSNATDKNTLAVVRDSTGFISGMLLLAIFSGYALTSLLLLKYPTLLHKKKKTKFTATHISHRGGAAENLENTVAAYHHALNCGTEMLEIDVHLTNDAIVVVSHDNHLLRSTGHDLYVSDTTYEELPCLKQTLKPDFCCNHVTEGGEDRKIPSLREVFELFPGVPINIDIKINNDLLCEKVNELICEYEREQITVWGNRSAVITEKLYKLNGHIPLLFSMKRVLHIVLLFYSGLLPFVPIKESFYEIPMVSVILRHKPTPIGCASRMLLRLIDFLLMNRSVFSHLRSRGIQVYLWVLNQDDDFHRGFKYGATGVMTDFPTRLRHYLDVHPEYSSTRV